MNQYGAQAMAHWERTMPQRLAELDDPEEYFTRLGEDLSQTIGDLARELAGPAPQQETYMERLRRLQTARFEAESQVMRQLVLEAEPSIENPLQQ